jgi:uncharacterized membrane protein
MSVSTSPVSAFRLRFIDMARAVAILLMLEGHFVDTTLAPEWRVTGNPVYEVWLYVRGMTAPMFFTVTGLVFAYLLSGARETRFWEVKRVRKGVVRAAELLFWGYLLQADLGQFPEWIGGGIDPWMGAFHVLQCIGIGLLGLIMVFGVVRKAGILPLAGAYAVAAMAVFLAAVALNSQPGYVPPGAPAWLQNALRGRYSVFPVAPWLGFTCYGAAAGVLVRHRVKNGAGQVSALAFFGIGLILKFGGTWLDHAAGGAWLTLLDAPSGARQIPAYFHGRIGEILMVLSFLIWIEKRIRPRGSWFETIGRNTFPIYVSHVVVLYGGIFGIGLQSVFEHRLNPWQAGFGALLFCGFFGFCAQWVEPAILRWNAWRDARND